MTEETEHAIRTAELWAAGKMIGGDQDEVRDALLAEVKRLRSTGLGATPFRVLDHADSFCPRCGHNRDTSSVSSIDHGDHRSCQKCGAAWREVSVEEGQPSADARLSAAIASMETALEPFDLTPVQRGLWREFLKRIGAPNHATDAAAPAPQASHPGG